MNERERALKDLRADIIAEVAASFPSGAKADDVIAAVHRRLADGLPPLVEVELVASCPFGNMPRSADAGHWRDWHRGHGCDRDPEAP